jgi:hypothetical protein
MIGNYSLNGMGAGWTDVFSTITGGIIGLKQAEIQQQANESNLDYQARMAAAGQAGANQKSQTTKTVLMVGIPVLVGIAALGYLLLRRKKK